jgi:hypothetical protein
MHDTYSIGVQIPSGIPTEYVVAHATMLQTDRAYLDVLASRYTNIEACVDILSQLHQIKIYVSLGTV